MDVYPRLLSNSKGMAVHETVVQLNDLIEDDGTSLGLLLYRAHCDDIYYYSEYFWNKAHIFNFYLLQMGGFPNKNREWWTKTCCTYM